MNRVSQKEVANRVLGQNQEQWGQIFSWTQLGGLHPAWSLGKKRPENTSRNRRDFHAGKSCYSTIALNFFWGETVWGELHDKSNNNPCFTV